MLGQLEIRDEIDNLVRHYREIMPDEIRELISKANRDLYSGPSYYDADGEECTCFDEGAIPFKFTDACATISEFLDRVQDLEVSFVDEDEDGNEIEWSERIDGTARQIVRALVGNELARYVS